MIADARSGALFRAESLFAEHVCDAAVLAGFDLSTDAVRRILAGDPEAPASPDARTFVLRQGQALGWVLRRVRSGTFDLTWGTARAVNALLTGAPHDETGEGAGTAGQPPACDPLPGVATGPDAADPLEEAVRVFLELAVRRPFAGGNVRTGYLLAEGAVLRAGLPAIGVPGPLRQEFDDLLRRCRRRSAGRGPAAAGASGAEVEAMAGFFRHCGRWP